MTSVTLICNALVHACAAQKYVCHNYNHVSDIAVSFNRFLLLQKPKVDIPIYLRAIEKRISFARSDRTSQDNRGTACVDTSAPLRRGHRGQAILAPSLMSWAEIGPELISAITGLINLLLMGICPELLRPNCLVACLWSCGKKPEACAP